MSKLQTTITITLTLLVLAPSAMAQQPEKYLLLATNRTGTMQDELNEAGARGYRFAGTQGGETAFGGREAVVIVALDPAGRRFRYILLATNRTGTMQSEMNEPPPEYNFAGMTVFSSTFGGREAAVILEAEITVRRGVPVGPCSPGSTPRRGASAPSTRRLPSRFGTGTALCRGCASSAAGT